MRLIANLGYGSRREVAAMFREGRITDVQGDVLYADDTRLHEDIRIDGETLDPPAGLTIMLHKPVGTTCSMRDPGRIVHDLLPRRYLRRDPQLSMVGRLDKDTSGLLLLTDDGALLHRIISPRSQVSKVYEATLAEPLRGDEAGIFASGALMLESEKTPLAPAQLKMLAPQHAYVTVTEGRYHQIRRMFAAVGNHVLTLHRKSIGRLRLDPSLAPGQWRVLGEPDIARIFTVGE